MVAYNFHHQIIRQYDIRGVVGETLSDEDAYYIGKSFAYLMKSKGVESEVCVGRDGRHSSPALVKSLVRGLMDSGVKVVEVGLVPTPALYYAAFTKTTKQCGIMITGSHNPPAYNGFKMVISGKPVFGDDIEKMANNAANGLYSEGHGAVLQLDVSEEYIEKVVQNNPITKQLKVVWDPGNGAGGDIISELIKHLPGEHEVINANIDGSFPSHHPDPTVAKNLEQLIERVKETGSDFGLAFDGDADRIGAVDSKGNIILGDQLLLIFAQDLLSRHPNEKVIADIKTGNNIFQQISEWGGQPIMWKTGHSFIKNKMKEEGALLAGEMSGHLFFLEKYFGFDDAIYAACKLISILSQKEESLSEVISSFPKSFSTPEMRIECDEEQKFQLIEEVKDHLNQKNIKFNDLDGVRVDSDDCWWLMRASNTQNCIIIRAEAQNNEKLSALIHSIHDMINIMDLELNISELVNLAA